MVLPGNGTQSIVWQINEETYQQTLESEQSPSEPNALRPTRGPQIFYGSIHDVLSFPCEVRDISVILSLPVIQQHIIGR